MGVNIKPYIITGRDEQGYCVLQPYKGDFRSIGERSFMREAEIEWGNVLDGPPQLYTMEDTYNRPIDIQAAIIQAHQHNRPDIAELFEEMKQNKDLYLYISY